MPGSFHRTGSSAAFLAALRDRQIIPPALRGGETERSGFATPPLPTTAHLSTGSPTLRVPLCLNGQTRGGRIEREEANVARFSQDESTIRYFRLNTKAAIAKVLRAHCGRDTPLRSRANPA